MMIRLFNFSRRNRLCIVDICDYYGKTIGYWLNGRIFGKYVSILIPTLKGPKLRGPYVG